MSQEPNTEAESSQTLVIEVPKEIVPEIDAEAAKF